MNYESKGGKSLNRVTARLRTILAWCILPIAMGWGTGYLYVPKSRTKGVSAFVGAPRLLDIPQVGDRISLPRRDSLGKSLVEHGKSVLVVAGNCQACASKTWNATALVGQSKIPLSIVYWMSKGELGPNIRSLGKKAAIFCDPKQLLLSEAFRDRILVGYLYENSTGKIIDIQADEESLEAFVERIGK